MFIDFARSTARNASRRLNAVPRSCRKRKAPSWIELSRKAARRLMPATGSVLLDTTIVVSVLRRVPGMQQRLVSASRLWLPLFALGELEYGVSHSSQPERQRQALSLFLQGVDLLLPSEATTQEYGRIKAALARAGTPIQERSFVPLHRDPMRPFLASWRTQYGSGVRIPVLEAGKASPPRSPRHGFA